jgi:hypothetical protein
MPKKFPTACVLFLGLLLMSEWIARSLWSYYLPTADYILLHKKKHWENRRSPDYDGIILGDSLSNGLDPGIIKDIIAQETGHHLSLYNYSFPQAGIRSYYLVLKRYLSLGKRPRIILFESMPLAMHSAWNLTWNPKGLSEECHRFFSLFSFQEYRSVISGKFLLQTWKMALERQSFLLTYRAHIRDYLHYRVLTYYPKMMERAQLNDQGRALMNVDREVKSEQIRGWFNYRMGFQADEEIINWYQRFFSLAKEHGIEVVIFNTPLIDDVFQKRENEGFHRKYQHVLTAMVKGYDNVTILQPVYESFDKRYFFDPAHLNDQGNDLFSIMLGHRLAQHFKHQGGVFDVQ